MAAPTPFGAKLAPSKCPWLLFATNYITRAAGLTSIWSRSRIFSATLYIILYCLNKIGRNIIYIHYIKSYYKRIVIKKKKNTYIHHPSTDFHCFCSNHAAPRAPSSGWSDFRSSDVAAWVARSWSGRWRHQRQRIWTASKGHVLQALIKVEAEAQVLQTHRKFHVLLGKWKTTMKEEISIKRIKAHWKWFLKVDQNANFESWLTFQKGNSYGGD